MSSKKKKFICEYREIKDIGFILVVFGVISVLAFVLPPKIWILVLGIVLVLTGIHLLRQ